MNANDLIDTWILLHPHEAESIADTSSKERLGNKDSHAKCEIYQRESSPLPPSRGRKGLSFRDDGSVELITPGAADRRQKKTAQWSFDSDTRTLEIADANSVLRRSYVESIDDTQMRLITEIA